ATIGRLLKPEKLTPAQIEFVDIAGLVEGASRGEGLGNRFLAHIRECHLILHLVRNFASTDAPHVFTDVNPDRDAAVVEAELALADLQVCEARLERLRKEPKTPENLLLLEALEPVTESLGREFRRPAADHCEALRPLQLFVTRPVIHALNCSDTAPADPTRFPSLTARGCLLFSSALEAAANGFAESEKAELRQGLGLAPEGPSAITARCFTELDLIRFYTIKGVESRAWSAPRGTTAAEAAGLIHTDLARGFIRAEVLNYADLVATGDFHLARDAGKVRIEGRNYVVQDGDVLHVRFRN
ncbi:MAG TPA: redox-regulated ATPase YchF, partial [candidate division WOR-3 bacterium]|nr:redox-regulated ATPase YchF [candidate division WOR-3 bacterium]